MSIYEVEVLDIKDKTGEKVLNFHKVKVHINKWLSSKKTTKKSKSASTLTDQSASSSEQDIRKTKQPIHS